MASETKFTPGPWIVDDDLDFAVCGSDGVQVADCNIFHDERTDNICKANAHLITAAPELLEQAELFERCLVYEIKKSKRDGDDEGARLKSFTLAMLLDVLSKARGEQ